jgi:hypothetical protein
MAFHDSQLIRWQIGGLKSAQLAMLIFLDEPTLCLDAAAGDSAWADTRLNALAVALEDARIREPMPDSAAGSGLPLLPSHSMAHRV